MTRPVIPVSPGPDRPVTTTAEMPLRESVTVEQITPAERASAERRLRANLTLMPNGCLEWTGYRDKAGYGHLRVGPRGKMRPHRLVWELANGPIPDGLKIRHRCDNRACCLLSHLELGTQADNVQDMRERGRERKAKGYDHPRSVGPEVEAAIVARWDRRKVLQKDLAAEFGIQRSTVQRILRRHGR